MGRPSLNDLLLWGGFAGILALLPFFLHSDFALSIASRMGIAVIFALSYNMLLGQGGMLSFGHAAYSGLGAYCTVHALNNIAASGGGFPVTFLPLVGGVAGMGFALLVGYPATRKSGTSFAMISLGIGELVASCVLMIPAFFGGESGISGNRVTGKGWFGIDYGSQAQMYGLVAGWTFACVAGMYLLTRTPFGRMSNAVRDNPERVAFVGYSAHLIRYQTLVMSSLFAGISGGLAALNNEIVTVEAVGGHASGAVLLMVFIGGLGHFHGPIIGAVVVTLLQTVLSAITPAWQFYFGLLFVLMVLFAPGGVAGIVAAHGSLRGNLASRAARLLPHYALGLAAAALLLAATIVAVESGYHHMHAAPTPELMLFGLALDPAGRLPWVAATVLVLAGIVLLRPARRGAIGAWAGIAEELHARNTGAARAAHARAEGKTR